MNVRQYPDNRGLMIDAGIRDILLSMNLPSTPPPETVAAKNIASVLLLGISGTGNAIILRPTRSVI